METQPSHNDTRVLILGYNDTRVLILGYNDTRVLIMILITLTLTLI